MSPTALCYCTAIDDEQSSFSGCLKRLQQALKSVFFEAKRQWALLHKAAQYHLRHFRADAGESEHG